MHNFERRIQQLLSAHPQLSPGHRERLMRPLKQSDVHSWGEVADVELEDILKVSFRSAVHELADAFCVHVETALAECRTSLEKTLLAALIGYAMPLGLPVLIRTASGEAGFTFTSLERLVIEPTHNNQSVLFKVLLERRDGTGNSTGVVVTVRATPDTDNSAESPKVSSARPSATTGEILEFSEAEILDDPFRCAARAFELLLRASPKE